MGPLDDLMGKEIQIEISTGIINARADDLIDSTSYYVDNYIKEKEGKNMENKYALINLYKKRKEEEIDKYYDNKIRVEKENSKIAKEYNNIIATATEELQKLYMSQFDEGELKTLNNGGIVEAKELCKTCSEIEVTTNVYFNELYRNMKCKEYDKARSDELNELADQVELIKANLAIASTKEEVEEILKRYEILDKNGKMVEI